MYDIRLRAGRASHSSNLLLLIPLVLSSFTHLWNPIGFPSIYVDEGHYLRRTLLVLEGSGHQEPPSAFNGYHPYDHPYLGQILLAFMLKIVGYPGSIDPISGEVASIEMLHLVPRMLMGFLAVVDTYLVYKISLLRYNRTFALAASILFAVMPMTWLLRRTLLDSLFLPLILTSIFFAVRHNMTKNKVWKHNREVSSALMSGIFLGLAIFTKIPAFTMIPLVGYLVIKSASSRKSTLGIWMIPVILIPAIWPIYAISYGQFELWVESVLWQANRNPRSLFDSINAIFEIDPVLTTLGIMGVVWATIRRDFFFLIWVLPYIIFLGLIGYSQYIHMALLLPAFSMSSAFLIQDSNKLRVEFKRLLDRPVHKEETKLTNPQQYITSFTDDDYIAHTLSAPPQTTSRPSRKHLNGITRFLLSNLCLIVLVSVAIFGLTNTVMLITTNVNGSLFEAYTAFVSYIPNSENEVTLTSSVRWGSYFYWIPKYVFDKELIFLDESSKGLPSTERVIAIEGRDNELTDISVLVGRVNNTASYYDYANYPYSNMRYNELGDLYIKGNY